MNISKNLLFSLILVIPIIFLSILGINSSSDVLRNLSWVRESLDLNLDFFETVLFLFQKKGFQGFTFIINHYIYFFAYKISENWQYIYITINIFFLLIFNNIIKNLFKDDQQLILLFVLTYFLFLNYDFLLWLSFPLPDFIFAINFFFILYNFLKKNFFIFFILLIISLFLKNTGLVVLFIFLQIVFLNFFKFNIFFKLILIFLINIFMGIIGTIIIHFLIYDIKFDIYTLNLLKRFAEAGYIIHERPYLATEGSAELKNYILLYCYKYIYFFKYVDLKFSFYHNLYNLLMYTPMYFFGILAILNSKSMNEDFKKIILTMFVTIISFANFFALTWIDYDWRYRLVILIPMAILAFIGIISIKHKLIRKYIF